MERKDFVQYTGTKTILAVPMTKADAEKHLSRKIDSSAVENPDQEEGYLVEYEGGYQSWSPKEMFEKAYRPSGTYLDRMRIEHAEYLARFHKLSDFLCSKTYRQLSDPEKLRLQQQLQCLQHLLHLLGEGIDYAESQSQN